MPCVGVLLVITCCLQVVRTLKNLQGSEWIEDDEKRLVNYIFKGYNKIARPVIVKTEAVPVEVGIGLIKLSDLVSEFFWDFFDCIKKRRTLFLFVKNGFSFRVRQGDQRFLRDRAVSLIVNLPGGIYIFSCAPFWFILKAKSLSKEISGCTTEYMNKHTPSNFQDKGVWNFGNSIVNQAVFHSYSRNTFLYIHWKNNESNWFSKEMYNSWAAKLAL